jgi:hypothetical protein
MAGNTKCYRVTVQPDGGLHFEVIEFSPRYCDNVQDALMRLRSGGQLQPPNLRFGDRAELEQRWSEGAADSLAA